MSTENLTENQLKTYNTLIDCGYSHNQAMDVACEDKRIDGVLYSLSPDELSNEHTLDSYIAG